MNDNNAANQRERVLTVLQYGASIGANERLRA